MKLEMSWIQFERYQVVLMLRFVFDVTLIIQALNVKRRLMDQEFWAFVTDSSEYCTLGDGKLL